MELDLDVTATGTEYENDRAFNYMDKVLETMPEATLKAMARPAFLAGARVGAIYIKAASYTAVGFKDKTGRLRRSIRAHPGTSKYPDTATIRIGGRSAPHARLVVSGHRVVRQYKELTTTLERAITAQDRLADRFDTGQRTQKRPFVWVGLERSVNPVVQEVASVMMQNEARGIREIQKLARRGFGL